MSVSPAPWILLGVPFGFYFGSLIGAQQVEESQLSETEKRILGNRAAEPAYIWPGVAVIFVDLLLLPILFLLSQEEDAFLQLILLVLWLGVLGVLVTLHSRKRQRLVREILSRRAAVQTPVPGQS
jgi:hypothetical protein